jgi:hypothetical protein
MTEAGVLSPDRAEVPDDLDDAFDEMYRLGWTDGLPVIPPTPARVAKFVAASGLPADHVVADLPPAGGGATIEKIAVNGVMAGCLPSYMPVLVAAVEALATPHLNVLGIQTTTNPVAPCVLVNGPIRRTLDINGGRGALGPGWRANATIGRAVRLIMLNVGGARPGTIDKSTLGFPGKYTFCFGELEEESPWEPFHVEHGYRREDSTVSIIAVQGTQSVAASYLEAESILAMIRNALMVWGTNSYNKGDGNPAVVLTPRHARIFADAGWTKRRIREWLYAETKVEESEMPVEPRLMKNHRVMDGTRICLCRQADDIAIIVAGGPEAYHIGILASYGNPMAMARISNAG